MNFCSRIGLASCYHFYHQIIEFHPGIHLCHVLHLLFTGMAIHGQETLTLQNQERIHALSYAGCKGEVTFPRP